MATTFGVKIPTEHRFYTEIAYRFSGLGNHIRIFIYDKELFDKLPDETEVMALDNTPQGIFTIGDIRKQLDIQRADDMRAAKLLTKTYHNYDYTKKSD